MKLLVKFDEVVIICLSMYVTALPVTERSELGELIDLEENTATNISRRAAETDDDDCPLGQSKYNPNLVSDGKCRDCQCGASIKCRWSNGGLSLWKIDKYCKCSDGKELKNKACEPGPCDSSPCKNKGNCTYAEGKDICLCPKGFVGRYCDPVDCETDEAGTVCGTNKKCTDKVCSCTDEYKDNAGVCEKVDCTTEEAGTVCGTNKKCTDKACSCTDEYKDNAGVCEKVDCTTEEAGTVCGTNKKCKDKKCSCTDEYKDNAGVCEKAICNQDNDDVVCGLNKRCHSGSCLCEEGYSPATGLLYRCTAICNDENNGLLCSKNKRCHSGMCQCEDGYRAAEENSYKCTEICNKEKDGFLCGARKVCDSGMCRCEDGYKPAVENPYQCTDTCDINCHNGRCEIYNEIPRCRCDPGYSGIYCQDELSVVWDLKTYMLGGIIILLLVVSLLSTCCNICQVQRIMSKM